MYFHGLKIYFHTLEIYFHGLKIILYAVIKCFSPYISVFCSLYPDILFPVSRFLFLVIEKKGRYEKNVCCYMFSIKMLLYLE